MAKARTKRKDERGPIQRLIDRERIEHDTAPLVNEFSESHGDYERNLRFVVNRGGTPVARWLKAGLLSESQQAGINHCVHLWAKLREPRVVANLDGNGGGYNEGWTLHQIEALDEIKRISGSFPGHYWDVFQNVCRFDEPAGVAGSKLQSTRKHSAETTARTIVCLVADMIAMRERLTF